VKFLPDELGILITTRDITRSPDGTAPAQFHNHRYDQPILTINPATGATEVADIRFRAAIEMDVRPRAAFGKRPNDAGTSISPTARTIRRAVTPAGKYRIRLIHHSVAGVTMPSPCAVLEFGDSLDQTWGWTLCGVYMAPAGNTGEISAGSGSYGRFTARLTYSGGTYKVEVFKGDLVDKVAEGTRNTPNGTITLSEVNSSGLSGSVNIEYRDDEDGIVLQVYGIKQDDTAELESYARRKRNALEAIAISGCPVIPWFTAGYELGDVITEVDGRDLDLQANNTSAAADKRYSQVVGIVWHLDEEQSTELILDDARQEG